MILKYDFYARAVQTVARELLGCLLLRKVGNDLISGMICETEAYDGEQDLACHARSGRTPRNQVMYERSGLAFIYFTYGMHWMLNCVADDDGYPAAVLIRAVIPLTGLDIIRKNRKGIPQKNWTDGPAKLTKAFQITGKLNGINLTKADDDLWIKSGKQIPENLILQSPRIGIENTPEPWRSKPWRYFFEGRALEFKKDII